MARIRIEDLPVGENLTSEEMEKVFGAGQGSFQPDLEALEARELMDAALGQSLLPRMTSLVHPQGEPAAHVWHGVQDLTAQQMPQGRFATNAGAAVSFKFVDSSGLPAGSFYYAVYGTDPATGQTVALNPNTGAYESTRTGAEHALTMYKLDSTVKIPGTWIKGARMIITLGQQNIAVHADGGVAAPSPSNPSTSNFYYDFIEFARDPNGSMNMDTSMVDQFGFPITFQPDGGKEMGLPSSMSRADVINGFRSFTQSNDAKAFADCLKVGSEANGIYRIVNPAQEIVLHGAGSPLHNYFDPMLNKFFSGGRGEVKLQGVDGVSYTGRYVENAPDVLPNTYDGNVAAGSKHAFRFEGGGKVFFVYDPRTPPAGVPDTSYGSSWMIFAQKGTFATPGGDSQGVLLDLENQVSGALNRGIAMNDAATWHDVSTFYKASSGNPDKIWNYFAQYMHQIGINNQAYAIPYDDKYEQAPDVSIPNPTNVTVTLGKWGAPTALHNEAPPVVVARDAFFAGMKKDNPV